jgi:hypothetical protein
MIYIYGVFVASVLVGVVVDYYTVPGLGLAVGSLVLLGAMLWDVVFRPGSDYPLPWRKPK